MYSSEIDKIMYENNYNIHADIYNKICDESPQIKHIKYDAFNNNFEIWTNDEYYWRFSIHR